MKNFNLIECCIDDLFKVSYSKDVIYFDDNSWQLSEF